MRGAIAFTLSRRRAAAVLAAAFAACGPADAALQMRTGTLRFTAVVELGPNVPDGATLTGTANAALMDALPGQGASVVAGVSKTAEVRPVGGAARFTVEVPYAFTFDQVGGAPAIQVSFDVRGGSSFASTSFSIGLPANGARTPVAFDLAL